MTSRHDTQRLTIADRTKAMVARPNIVPAAIAGFLLCMLIGGLILLRSHRMRATPAAAEEVETSVGVVKATSTVYANTRRYVGRLEPWAHAIVGPKTLSAYVAAVMVRPGDDVVKGDVLATLDCRNALAAGSQHQAPESASTASSRGSADCTFRAPFDGEVATRTADPGTFVAPGQAILTLVDRSTVRLVIDVPESDFTHVTPGTAVTIRSLATGGSVTSRISRRAPAADMNSHSVSVEIDLTDDEKLLPLGTMAEITTQLGEPASASEIPASAAKIRGDIATVMVIDGDTVSRVRVKLLGERDGKVYVEPSLSAGTQVVVDSSKQLRDGDHVVVRQDEP
ncbi:MAG: efflux RND transporter periplasmic adaptor subunit [Myxococcota bacterium]|nr:efflux RND transporter periplasmic adaptor subunit [Myxococcota bacterium]